MTALVLPAATQRTKVNLAVIMPPATHSFTAPMAPLISSNMRRWSMESLTAVTANVIQLARRSTPLPSAPRFKPMRWIV